MLDILLKEENWFLAALVLGLVGAMALVTAERRRQITSWTLATSACNLFFGVFIGIAGLGHLFAVTTKIALGTLPPDIRLWFAIPFGFALAGPAWWLASETRGLVRGNMTSARTATWLNVWLALVLASQGPAVVLAAPAGLDLLLLHRSARAKRATAGGADERHTINLH